MSEYSDIGGNIKNIEGGLLGLYTQRIEEVIDDIRKGLKSSKNVTTLDGSIYFLKKEGLQGENEKERLIEVKSCDLFCDKKCITVSDFLELLDHDFKEAYNIYHQLF